MSLVYVFAASSAEGRPVRKIGVPSSSNSYLRCGPNDVVLVTVGMGPINARSRAEAVLKRPQDFGAARPDAVLTIGLCGGLTASLPETRVVAYTECKSVEGAKPLLRCSPAAVDSFTELLKRSNIHCDPVVGITSTRIATNPPQRLALAQLGAATVDMESYSILETAASAGIPAAVLRVVSDAVDRDLPDFNLALNDDGSLDGRKALRIALASPLLTVRMLLANMRAMRQLGKALEIILKAPCFA
jgi:nucleoside phosphorylase